MHCVSPPLVILPTKIFTDSQRFMTLPTRTESNSWGYKRDLFACYIGFVNFTPSTTPQSAGMWDLCFVVRIRSIRIGFILLKRLSILPHKKRMTISCILYVVYNISLGIDVTWRVSSNEMSQMVIAYFLDKVLQNCSQHFIAFTAHHHLNRCQMSYEFFHNNHFCFSAHRSGDY